MQALRADLCGIFLPYAALHSQGLLLMKKYHVIFQHSVIAYREEAAMSSVAASTLRSIYALRHRKAYQYD